MAKKIDLDGLEHFKQKENASIAGTESSSTASKAYKVGQHFYFKGTLVVCTVDIASGGTITLNTNCKVVPLADEVSDLKTQLTTFTHVQELQFSDPANKQYIKTGNENVGATISLTPVSSVSYYWKYSITPCSEGDVFEINGEGMISPLLWAFLDADNKLLADKSEQNATATNLLIVAPANAAKLVVNDKSDSTSYKGYIYTAAEINKKIIDDTKISFNVTGTPTTGLVNCNNGNADSATGYEKTDFIPIVTGAEYYYSGTIVDYAGICGYDASKTFVASILDETSSGSYKTYQEKLLTIPNTVKFIRACSRTSGNVPINITEKKTIQVFGIETDNRLDKLETELSPAELFSIAMFQNMAVIGDSYSSGYISISGTGYTRKGLSWLSVLGRKSGAEVTHYSTAGLNTATWLTNETYGLAKMLSDPAKDLYCIMLGINPEPEEGQAADPTADLGSLEDCNVDYTQNADTCYGRYGRIIGNVKTHAPKGKIFCIIPPSRYNNKKTCIEEVSEFYEVPCIDTLNDSFFENEFYTDNRSAGHPLAISYSGMALALERLMAKYIVDNPTYFKDYLSNA